MLLAAPISSEVEQGGGAIYAPPPSTNGSWLETPAPSGLSVIKHVQLILFNGEVTCVKTFEMQD